MRGSIACLTDKPTQTGCSSSADAERESWEPCSEWEELGMTETGKKKEAAS